MKGHGDEGQEGQGAETSTVTPAASSGGSGEGTGSWQVAHLYLKANTSTGRAQKSHLWIVTAVSLSRQGQELLLLQLEPVMQHHQCYTKGNQTLHGILGFSG